MGYKNVIISATNLDSSRNVYIFAYLFSHSNLLIHSKHVCRTIKSYRGSIGMIPSCRIQFLINQQSYTPKYRHGDIFESNKIRLSIWLVLNRMIRWNKLEINKNVLFHKNTIAYYILVSFKSLYCDGNSIKAYKMHCFCWKGGSYSFTNCTFPNIHIICFVQTQFCFRWTKYIAQYMYHK